VARQLLSLGFDTAALEGGYNAWRAAYPVEPKNSSRLARLENDSGDGLSSHPITFVE
jgi:hypothetical protein